MILTMHAAAASVSPWHIAAHGHPAPVGSPDHSCVLPFYAPLFASGRLTRSANRMPHDAGVASIVQRTSQHALAQTPLAQLCRLAPAASLSATASGLRRPCRPDSGDLTLKQKPELSEAPEPDSIPWNKFTEVSPACTHQNTKASASDARHLVGPLSSGGS